MKEPTRGQRKVTSMDVKSTNVKMNPGGRVGFELEDRSCL
jgi:hypothetical protein